MNGMGSGSFSLLNALVVSVFRRQLYVTSVAWIIALSLVILIVATLLRRVQGFNLSATGLGEPRNRTLLRLSFGALWLVDGLLQFQPSMPLGLANQVVRPMAASTPGWLHDLMNSAINLWNAHPVGFAVGVAWLQVGLGVLLLISNGSVGRIAAALSAGWAALIWLIGNGAGGVFDSSSSILFGWPGATLFYVVAGVWLAGPRTNFPQRFSKVTLRGLGILALLGAVLQCLPSREFWHGGSSNALTAMTQSMTQTPQPTWLASSVKAVGTLAGTMGGGFNVAVILWLVISGVGLWLTPARNWSWGTWTFIGGALFFWIAAQDTALFGGLATDVNSLVPLAALTWCASAGHATSSPLERRLPREIRSSTGAVLASFAGAMVIFSLALMGWTSVASAENSLFLAHNGPASAVDVKNLPSFSLTDQHGHRYTLGMHPGRTTLLVFLDPRCSTDCPLMAEQVATVRKELSANAAIDVVAVAANPYHESLSDVRSFIAQRQLTTLQNFYFVTGSRAATSKVWSDYGITVVMKPTDKMSAHSNFVFLIDGQVHLRWVITDDPLASAAGAASTEGFILNLLHGMGVH